MIAVILIACAMVAVTVVVHVCGFALLLRWLMKSHAVPTTQTGSIAWLLIRVAWTLILIHMAEVIAWALCYLCAGCLPDLESAAYFSGVSYTTIGFGDLVLTKPWRILGPIEGLTGILMCGLSAGLFFALVSRIYLSRLDTKRK